jgi:hypothetical protein
MFHTVFSSVTLPEHRYDAGTDLEMIIRKATIFDYKLALSCNREHLDATEDVLVLTARLSLI